MKCGPNNLLALALPEPPDRILLHHMRKAKSNLISSHREYCAQTPRAGNTAARHYTIQFNFCRYNGPPQSRSLFAACSGVMSRCGSAIISYPTRNFRTVALRSKGG